MKIKVKMKTKLFTHINVDTCELLDIKPGGYYHRKGVSANEQLMVQIIALARDGHTIIQTVEGSSMKYWAPSDPQWIEFYREATFFEIKQYRKHENKSEVKKRSTNSF